ncbi:MAG TPA: nitrous oxide reductase accessory protein NosL [Ohtaekwangia sp.]
MKNILFILMLLTFMNACSVKPEPLQFGKDACYACKMTLMDQKFGSEIVTKKGKVYKFDDVNCMIGFYKSGYEPQENIAHHLVIDFMKPGELIDVKSAQYIRSEAIRSPMASQVAAFNTTQDLDSILKEWNGHALTWEKLVKQFE